MFAKTWRRPFTFVFPKLLILLMCSGNEIVPYPVQNNIRIIFIPFNLALPLVCSVQFKNQLPNVTRKSQRNITKR
jgi:hypothetical protein